MTKQLLGAGDGISSDARQEPPYESGATDVAGLDISHTPFALTDLQQAYWIGQTDLMELGNMFAHIYTEIEFFDLDLMRVSLVVQRLVERHPALRTIILADGTQQVLSSPGPYQIIATDLRGQMPHEVEEHLALQRRQLGQHGPKTDTWPLWEIRASLLDNGRTRLHLSISLQLVDGRSMGILSAEALRLYQNLDVSLPDIEMTFRECIDALDAIKQSPRYQKSAQYWQRRLSDLPTGPELPLLKQPTDLKEVRFVSRSAILDNSTWQRFKDNALRHGLRSPVAAIYTAYAEILGCWSSTTHFCFTLLFAHSLSQQTRAKGVVGNLSTTILVEVNHQTPGSFMDRAKRLERQIWQDIAHSDLCGVQIIRELGRQQGWSTKAMVPVAFVSTVGLSNQQNKGMFMGTEEQGKVIYYCVQTPQVYLDHQIYETSSGLRLEWDMVDELFPPDLPDTMFAVYHQLLCSLAEDEARWEQPSVSLVPHAQIAHHHAINATTTDVPPDLLHTLFARQAQQRPDQLAVVSSRGTLTYAEVDCGSNVLGRKLRQLGVQPNNLIAVVMEKGWEQVVATLGIMYAGAAYLPIDPALPQERLWYLLEHGQVQHVLTQPWINDRLTWPPTVQRHCVDDEALCGPITSILEPLQTQDDLAYVIYTSGSTGQPKGVMIDHRGAVNTIIDINQRFEVTAIDRVLALSSLSFDLSVYDIFGMLAAGGTIVLPDPGNTLNPTHWLQLITQHQVTIWNSVPALIEILAEYIEHQPELYVSTLRLAMLSGDWIPLKLPGRLHAMQADLRVVSLGGATEASIWSIIYPINQVEASWKSIPYGWPMLNQQMYVLDANLNHRAYWVPGQIYIGGIGLAKGYWRDPHKTAASFITHPRTGERLYRTGDLGCYRPDGTIEFLGREDFQVKVQGHRIELGEIEVVLNQHAAVREAIASVETNPQGEKRLVAYVVTQAGNQPSRAELITHARNQLPAYMVPVAIGFLDALPLNANGKVNRKALPPLHLGDASTPALTVSPRNAVEQQLVKLWETTLYRSPIGINDNFFELGGNSLAALRLMNQIRQQFAQDLPFSLLFEHATISSLAEVIQGPLPVPYHHSPLVTIRSSGSKPSFFCIHPVGGNVLCYAELAHHLPEHPFYALQAPGLYGEETPHESVIAMATAYMAAIQAVQPQGPYIVGGWSMGGLIAFEIAQQLCQAGQDVNLVALIDSAAPTPAEREKLWSDLDLLIWFAKDLWGSAGKHAQICAADLQGMEPAAQVAFVLEQAKRAGVLAPEIDQLELLRLLEVFKTHTRALLSYHPQQLHCPVVQFATQETLATYSADQTLGWEPYTSQGVRVYMIDADHYSLIVPPKVAELAEQLSQEIISHASTPKTS